MNGDTANSQRSAPAGATTAGVQPMPSRASEVRAYHTPIDAITPPPQRALVWMCGIIYGTTVGVVLGFYATKANAVVGSLGFVIAFGVPIFIAYRVRESWIRRLRSMVSVELGTDRGQELARIRGVVPYLDPHSVVSEYLRRLACIDHAPMAIRIAPSERPDVVSPIAVPFEPVPIDEAACAMRRLDPDAWPVADAPILQSVRRTTGLMWTQFVVPLSCLAVILVGWYADSSRSHRGFRVGIVEAVGVAILVVCTLLWIRRRGPQRECLVVPGGLVTRAMHQGRPGWDVRLFSRRDAVLCVVERDLGRCTIFVADRETLIRRNATLAEARFALRAWLSPHEPPTPDQLSDLE